MNTDHKRNPIVLNASFSDTHILDIQCIRKSSVLSGIKKKKKLREHEEMWITYYFCQTEKKYADEFFCNIICKNLFDNSRSTQNKVPSLSNKVRGDVLYSLNRLLTHRNPLT